MGKPNKELLTVDDGGQREIGLGEGDDEKLRKSQFISLPDLFSVLLTVKAIAVSMYVIEPLQAPFIGFQPSQTVSLNPPQRLSCLL